MKKNINTFKHENMIQEIDNFKHLTGAKCQVFISTDGMTEEQLGVLGGLMVDMEIKGTLNSFEIEQPNQLPEKSCECTYELGEQEDDYDGLNDEAVKELVTLYIEAMRERAKWVASFPDEDVFIVNHEEYLLQLLFPEDDIINLKLLIDSNFPASICASMFIDHLIENFNANV